MFQKVKRVTMRNLCDTIFCINTSVLQNFHICMSVPLIKQESNKPTPTTWGFSLY